MLNCHYYMLQIKAEITENTELFAKTYYQLSLKTGEISRLAKAGQFVHLRVNQKTVPLLRRPFSIHSVGEENLQILYKVIGKGTEILAQRKKGELLDIIGPSGNGYKLPEGKIKVVLVAGGIGVASLYFLAEELTSPPISSPRAGETPPKPSPASGEGEREGGVVVLIGGKSREDILCQDKFKKLNVDVVVSTEDGTSGRKGLVTDLLQELLPTPRSPLPIVVYACGPMEMLKETAKIAGKYAVPCYLSLEKIIACGVGACQGCVINTKDGYQKVCKDGPVFDSERIIW